MLQLPLWNVEITAPRCSIIIHSTFGSSDVSRGKYLGQVYRRIVNFAELDELWKFPAGNWLVVCKNTIFGRFSAVISFWWPGRIRHSNSSTSALCRSPPERWPSWTALQYFGGTKRLHKSEFYMKLPYGDLQLRPWTDRFNFQLTTSSQECGNSTERSLGLPVRRSGIWRWMWWA